MEKRFIPGLRDRQNIKTEPGANTTQAAAPPRSGRMGKPKTRTGCVTCKYKT
jgi:hypothetical protein